MKKEIVCGGVLALAMLSPGSVSGAEKVTEEYAEVTRLMGVAAKAKYEGKDEVAWGEYARACAAAAEIRRQHPEWNSSTVNATQNRCMQEMDALNPASVEGARDILSGQRKALEGLVKAAAQAEAMIRVINESRDFLEITGSRKAVSRKASKRPGQASVDTDGDGLSDDQELTLGTNPSLVDTDSDDLSDFREVNSYGTNPLQADTDNDGLTDGFEVKTFNTDPLNPDTDGEGLLDGEERMLGTDPNDPDTDGDGDNDKEEVDNDYDPLTPKFDQ